MNVTDLSPFNAADLNHIAETYSTPCYVYDHATLVAAFNAFDQALQARRHLVCYAVKEIGRAHV